MDNDGSRKLSVREFQPPGHRTSYREGAAAVRGPVVAWNDDKMTSGGPSLTTSGDIRDRCAQVGQRRRQLNIMVPSLNLTRCGTLSQ